VSTVWGNPVTDEINRLTTESAGLKSNIATLQSQLTAMMTPTTWKALPLSAGFENWAGGYWSASYLLVGQIVYLRGLIRNNTGANLTGATVFATLPSEAVPLTNIILPAMITSTTDGHTAKRMGITANTGVMNIYATAADTIVNASGYIALDNLWFTKQASN